ncbi:MAG: hypothetical protein WC310_01240 [Patescibacteria group bacterium]|jgi:hypothetical protein
MADVKLNFLLVCEQALVVNEDKGVKVSVINIINRITAPNLPAFFPKFSVVTKITGDKGVYDQEIKIVSPLGKPLAGASGKSKIDDAFGHTFVADFSNVPLSDSGKYKIEVSIKKDDEEAFSVISDNSENNFFTLDIVQ